MNLFKAALPVVGLLLQICNLDDSEPGNRFLPIPRLCYNDNGTSKWG